MNKEILNNFNEMIEEMRNLNLYIDIFIDEYNNDPCYINLYDPSRINITKNFKSSTTSSQETE